MRDKTMWFHHLSIVWNVVSTIVVLAFVLAWFWYGISVQFGDPSHPEYSFHTGGLKQSVQQFKQINQTSNRTHERIDQIKDHYNSLFEEIQREARIKIAASTLTSADQLYYDQRVQELQKQLNKELEQVIKEAYPAKDSQAGQLKR